MPGHKVLFLTQRGQRHQQDAIDSAPPEFEIIMRREISRGELLDLLSQAEFLISERAGVVDAEMIAASKHLRLIQRLGRQTWDIDTQAAQSAGIPVCCLPIPGCQLVAEHMLLQALALAKRLRETSSVAEAAGNWGPSKECSEDYFVYNWSERKEIGGLFGKTFGILGFGEIGLELARRLRAFDCRVLYNKRQRLPESAEAAHEIAYASQAQIQAEADVIVNLLPDFPETHRLLNAGFYAGCKRGAFMVHAGGGTTVDAQATAAALRSGQLGGAALDTFNWEPIRADDPLVRLAKEDPQANLILTPHTAAGAGSDKAGPTRRGDYRNLSALINGTTLEYRVV